MSGGFVFHAGHDLEHRTTFWWTISTRRARKSKWDRRCTFWTDFHVAGIVEHGKGARLFVFMSTLQDMSGARDKASVFFIKCDRTDHTAAVTDEIRQLLPGYEIRPLKDFISLMTSSDLPGLGAFINMMIGIAVAIGFLVIFLSMYTTIIERTREIGVLKSLGASKAYIVGIILSETTLLCLSGLRPASGSVTCCVGFLSTVSLADDFDHSRWILHFGVDCDAGRTPGGGLSGVDGEPQGPGRGAGVRVSRYPSRLIASTAFSG